MERFLQYLDDLDDLYGAIRLATEPVRYLVKRLLCVIAAMASAAGASLLALVEPPLALATATLLISALLYRSVTSGVRVRRLEPSG